MLLAPRRAAGLILSALVLPACLQFQKEPGEIGLAHNYVEVGNDRIYIEDHGPKDARDTLLLVHGFGATGRSWSFVLPALARHFRVLVVDLPGFGRSDKYPGDYSMDAVGRKVLTALKGRRAKQVHLVCHSWGTGVCLAMGLRAPARVRSMTLISSFAYEDQLPPFLVWARVPALGELLFGLMWDSRLDDRMDYSFYNPDKHVHPAAIDEARKLLRMPGALAASLAAARGMEFSMHARYGELKQPVLIISGRDDAVTRLPAARRLNNDLPNARHLVIPQCGHIPFVEQPAKVTQALLAFLGKHRTPPSRPTPPAPAKPPKPADPDVEGVLEEVAFQ